MGHPRLLAGGTKEEENGEEDVAVLGLEGGEGGDDDEEVVGQVGLCQTAGGQLPTTGGAGPGF